MTTPKTKPARRTTRPAAPRRQVKPAPETTPRTKTELVLSLLRRKEGAILSEIVGATGWLPHTTRAALTGLRKKGHVLEKSKRDQDTCYRIAAVTNHAVSH